MLPLTVNTKFVTGTAEGPVARLAVRSSARPSGTPILVGRSSSDADGRQQRRHLCEPEPSGLGSVDTRVSGES